MVQTGGLMADKRADNKRISSLDGLKAIMMFMIFCWHTPQNPDSPEPRFAQGGTLFLRSYSTLVYNAV